LYAEVRVIGNAQPVFTDPDVGDYHRMLLPGEYALRFSAEGYEEREVAGAVAGSGPALRLDIALEPEEAGPIVEPPQCPAEVAFAAQPHVLADLRAFRDGVLAKNDAGKAITNAYYAAAPAASGTVRRSPLARAAFSAMAKPFALLGAAASNSD
jgi:hypothetical protein